MAARRRTNQKRSPRKSPPWQRPKGEGSRRPKPRSATTVRQREADPEATGTPSGLWSKVLQATAKSPDAKGLASDTRGLVRLNLYLARCGVASRRGADELVAQGRVLINGATVRKHGTKVDPLRDTVVVDDVRLKPERPAYVILHKPPGVVCTNARNEQKKRAIDLVPIDARLFSVGRLDLDSEGLLLLTNDGSFAERMTHPRYGVPKVYDVTVRGRIEHDQIAKARGGVWLAEGKTQGARIRIKRRGRERSYLEVSIREGRNREVRRIFARLGFPVLRLRRTRIGPLMLRGLGRGKFRFLKKAEVEALLEWSERTDV